MRHRTELGPYGQGIFVEPQDFVNDMFRSFFSPARSGPDGWAPPAEVVETPQAYVVNVDAPGIDPNEVQVTLVGDTLTIQGERKAPVRAEGERVHFAEGSHGSFVRTFTFPVPVSPDTVEASSKNGVLSVTITKAREAQPRRIQIKTA